MKQIYKGKILTKQQCINNILLYYAIADKNEGIYWYNDAHDFAQELAIKYNKPIEQICGIIAAFSPQTSWYVNKSFAISFLINPKAITSNTARTLKARKILKCGNNPHAIYNALAIKEGALKTKTFYSNILYPNDLLDVTIDRHAIAAATQKPHEAEALSNNEAQITTKQYYFFEDCYKEVANDLGLYPHQLQAIVWTVYRKLRELKSYDVWKPINNEVTF